MCWIFKTLDFGLLLHRCTLVKREWLLAAKSFCTDWSRYGRRGKRKGDGLLDLLQVLGPHVSDTHRGDMTQLCYQAPEKPKRKPTDTFLTVMKHHETSYHFQGHGFNTTFICLLKLCLSKFEHCMAALPSPEQPGLRLWCPPRSPQFPQFRDQAGPNRLQGGFECVILMTTYRIST